MDMLTPDRRSRGRPGLTEQDRERALGAATELMSREGLDGIKARAVAQRAGISIGSIYKMFGDIDDLVRAVNLQTYQDFADHQRLALDAASLPGATVQMRLMSLARAYVDFVLVNERRWSALLSFSVRQTGSEPEAYSQTRQKLFDLVESVMIDLPRLSDVALRSRSTHALWAAVHGIVFLALPDLSQQERLVETIQQIELIVTAVVRDAGG